MNNKSAVLGHQRVGSLLDHPIRSLLLIFLVWKTVLLLVAAGTPGPGYDTSGLILFDDTPGLTRRHIRYKSFGFLDRFGVKYLSWDAIYFTKLAERGYLHEQEWAFSWAFTRILNFLTRSISADPTQPLASRLWAGIILSNLCHLLSVFVLHLALVELHGKNRGWRSIPFLAASLHVVSPAGLFLSAPYCESLFSLLSFSGTLCYVRSQRPGTVPHRPSSYFYILASGTLFGMATLIRNNGLLWGLIFLYDAMKIVLQFLSSNATFRDFWRLVIISMAGSAIFVGFVGPQWVAYSEYCLNAGSGEYIRPWCTRTIPSIYSWVQSHYWNVGFLRYWTLSNVPLILLAAPMLSLLFQSSVTVLRKQLPLPSGGSAPAQASERPSSEQWYNDTLQKLALPQLVLAILTTTNFHIQIINRLSSGYPVWYYVVATWLVGSSQTDRTSKSLLKRIVYCMIMYAIIQGALFSSFLPPA